MKFCMQCGHELGASRTCQACGTTAPVEPLPAPQLPPAGVRYPLFADEVDSVSVTTSGHVLTAPVTEPVAGQSAMAQPPATPPAAPPPAATTEVRLPAVPVVPPRRHAGGGIWAALVLLVVGVLALGGWLVLHGGSDDSADSPAGSGASAPAGDAQDVAATARASAPVTRAPGEDTDGNRTTYAASNMLDGDTTTAWEMPGDGTGKELTFTLAKRTHLTEVGLVNGYAKTSKQNGATLDWYAGNRRILQVEWLFDDGTTVTQDLREAKGMQSTDVDATTRTVRLRLVDVSDPGTGPAGRNMTAVSEVSLTGTQG